MHQASISNYKKSITPPLLQEGDTVAIVAPARFVTYANVQAAVNWLQAAGLKVVIGHSIDKKLHQFAGDDLLRATDLQNQLNDPTIKAIWFARGGYGCVRIVDLVHWETLLMHPKWLIGYSDITIFHAKANAMGVQTLHADMPFSFENTEKNRNTFDAILSVLFRGKHAFEMNLPPHSRVVGGNLSVWYSLLGSDTFPSTANSILFFEDLEEYTYHLDRMFRAIFRAGHLKQIEGIALGGFTNLKDNETSFGFSIQAMLQPLLPPNCPIFNNIPAGHTALNLPLVLG